MRIVYALVKLILGVIEITVGVDTGTAIKYLAVFVGGVYRGFFKEDVQDFLTQRESS